VNFFVSTIVRDRQGYLSDWYHQLKQTVLSNPNDSFYLSVYENDSRDQSKSLLKSFDFSFFKKSRILTENKNTPIFPSIKHDLRVKLLAEARNKTFDVDFLNQCDYVLSVEPDIKYSTIEINKVIHNNNYDILSAISIQNGKLYDTWATRKDESKEDSSKEDLFENCGIIDLWTTYNCYCKYKAEPIKKGVLFSPFNNRLNKHDCDTAVICENFRSYGYNKIAIDTSAKVYHP
jgi:hypothetical protein